ncbi:hypothetical protein B0H16DRAFT_1717632 [Mycena metata]|uniref:Uncharacterized protein n=1 Tax=Mycena metata TaxID=1033252 RepID=A0AAD7JLA7_9AGAR|nr:hypothetical protein B0H16DRAFT_1717632 [Mycena metata]
MDPDSRLNNLRGAYHSLNEDVLSALRVMVGDPPRLNAVRDRALALASAAEMHRGVYPAAEYAVLQTSISEMVTALDHACHESMDPPDAAPLVVARRVRTGRRGCPRVEIDPTFLQAALDLRGPTGIAPEIAADKAASCLACKRNRIEVEFKKDWRQGRTCCQCWRATERVTIYNH